MLIKVIKTLSIPILKSTCSGTSFTLVSHSQTKFDKAKASKNVNKFKPFFHQLYEILVQL